MKTRFDLDYWGLTNREALQAILAEDERPSIQVWQGSWTPLATSALMLQWSDRTRIHVVPEQADADYIVTNYRGDQRDYAAANQDFELFRQITVDGEIVNSTYVRTPAKSPGGR